MLVRSIRKTFLILGSFICSILIIELFFQYSHISDTAYNDFHEDIGHAIRANHKFVAFNEGFCIRKTNNNRFLRKNSISISPSSNSYRVALLGDSYIESVQVFERDYFGEVADSILSIRYPRLNFELLNFGLSGIDIGDMYAYHTNMIAKFKPDLILYFLSKDDLIPKYRDRLRPKTIILNNDLHIDNEISKTSSQDYTLFATHHSSFIQLLNKCRLKAKSTPLLSIFLGKLYGWFTGNNIQKKDINHQTLNTVTKKILSTLDNKNVIIVNRDTVSLPDYFIEECNKNNLRYYSLTNKNKKINDFLYWSRIKSNGHWNKKGHKAVGEQCANIISEQIK